ncbi:hypothetical protein P691DRAFT_815224 [Macrolepiota fuliginosa MF-IS2]|uniref:Uncharacterized protein n=1 Tax=Macrolepiota fuliginosa MF-IS2 TaxID=1400762 RepID=A0A9P5X012_9AGAR|nr:hypothetical protein P691DRAFT_815224 [Macrolepiota fuliginosa MF-IS2]
MAVEWSCLLLWATSGQLVTCLGKISNRKGGTSSSMWCTRPAMPGSQWLSKGEGRDLIDFVDQLINGNVTTNISLANIQIGIDILLEVSNPDTTHNSAAHNYTPQCQPGTCKQYIKDIVGWGVPAVGADEPLPLFWMKGLASVGKSAIAQTCTEEIKKLGRLGAAFFFTETMEIQFKALVIEPFQELEKTGKGIGQKMVLLPVSNDTNPDIKLYLCSGFKNILQHCNIPMTSQWPSENDIQMLVKALKGLFVYAATVLRDVDQARLLCSGWSYSGSGYTSGVMWLSNLLGLSKIGFQEACNQLSAMLHIHNPLVTASQINPSMTIVIKSARLIWIPIWIVRLIQ